ncbi:unnamed protein product, partial [Mesorhabditis spiculigera]
MALFLAINLAEWHERSSVINAPNLCQNVRSKEDDEVLLITKFGICQSQYARTVPRPGGHILEWDNSDQLEMKNGTKYRTNPVIGVGQNPIRGTLRTISCEAGV